MSEWFTFHCAPRFSDTDAYGIVHHSMYYQWLEEARFAFAKERLGWTLDRLNAENVQVVVLTSACQHRSAVHYGDKLQIELKLVVHKAAKFGFEYRVRNAQTKVVHAIASTSHVYIRPDGTLLLKHPDWFLQAVAEVADTHPDELVRKE
ncbi:MAG TPA: thioesterase family protein [Symbiobacteriaceae bacterium]|nr:thioesterase family protein [Symbiobacteriaceae bacterium]